MTSTIEIGGEEYELEGNPSLGTVREVQSMQMGVLLDHVGEDKLMEMDNLEDESEIVKAILDEGGFDAFQNVMWERNNLENLQTLSLAADEPLDSDDLDEIPAREYGDYVDEAEDALGGSASDFFNDLGIGISLQEEKMREQAQAQTELKT